MQDDGSEPTYLDSGATVSQRIDDLLDRMTLEEKIGQLLVSSQKGSTDEVIEALTTKIDDCHLGQASPFGRPSAPNTPEAAIEVANELQQYAVEETRLGIPLLLISNAIHGNAFMEGATVFPHSLGMAATRDDELAEQAASVSATELAVTGADQNYAPVCDVGREPRWGRVFETFGESPYLCARMSAAKIDGYQKDDLGDDHAVVATAKHFPAYGEPFQGEDSAPVEISERTFRDSFLPPFEAAIDADVESVMPCYNSINRTPVHGSPEYLTDLLREELGFEGFTVSDHHGVEMLHEEHKTAKSMREATWQSVTAGMDTWLGPDVYEYRDQLTDLVEGGEVPERRIDESVRRILSVKFRLGLFEDPYVDLETARQELGKESHRELARECTRKSLTLLQNEGDLLPLDDGCDEIFVAGPTADELDYQYGGWSRPNNEAGTTVREGIEEYTDEASVTYEQGATLRERQDIEAAAQKAAEADVAVVAVGEGQYIHEFGRFESAGEPGEFPNRTALDLPPAQRELVEAVHETGTPTVVTVISGRPLSISWCAEHVPAILMAYYPGSEAGTEIARALFGDTNPSGRLPISIPRSAGHLPTRFNYLPHPGPIGEEQHPPSYDPLFSFGHGLSYTDFEYENLRLSAEEISPGETLEVRVDVQNSGDRRGATSTDLFVSDRYSSHVTPVRRLKGYNRVELEPGETQTLTFSVPAMELGVVGSQGRPETGEFEISVEGLTATVRLESSIDPTAYY